MRMCLSLKKCLQAWWSSRSWEWPPLYLSSRNGKWQADLQNPALATPHHIPSSTPSPLQPGMPKSVQPVAKGSFSIWENPKCGFWSWEPESQESLFCLKWCCWTEAITQLTRNLPNTWIPGFCPQHLLKQMCWSMNMIQGGCPGSTHTSKMILGQYGTQISFSKRINYYSS